MAIVIVGGGVTGGSAAVGLREEGYDGEIVILGDEPGVPFARPPLSKEYMREREEPWLVQDPGWYEDNGVELRTSAPVERLDTAARSVVLQGGDEVEWDRLLIATGCRPRAPAMEGIDLDGVLPLRTKAQSDEIRERALRPGANVVIAGMSFIGAEVASSLRQLGVHVTAVFPGAGPLVAVLGQEVSERLADLHSRNGVELIAGEKVKSFAGSGHVEAVVTESGRTLECTLAVIGLGVQPNVELLEGSGVEMDDGVLVDERCRTNVDGVFAAGDVANHLHPLFGRIRIEHYNNAEKHGRHAAGAMVGKADPYDYVHSFWSDQFGRHLDYIGYAQDWDRFVTLPDDGSGGLLGLYLKDDALKAAVGLDRGGDPEADPDSELGRCADLIRSGEAVDPDEPPEGL